MRNVLTLCLLLLAGCAGSPPPPAPMESAPYEPIERSGGTELKPSEDSQQVEAAEADDEAAQRVIISTADLRLETQNPDSVHHEVVAIGLNLGGYILKSTPDETSLRLPAVSFHDALERIENLGKVVDKDISGEDITDQYRDLEMRLDNALKTRERYLRLLSEAMGLQETLRMERELERINLLIENLKGQINRFSHLTRYATITVETSRKTRSGPVAFALEQMYNGVKWLFVWK